MLHLRNYVSALYVATSVRPVFRRYRVEYISFASQASDVAGPWAATADVELAALLSFGDVGESIQPYCLHFLVLHNAFVFYRAMLLLCIARTVARCVSVRLSHAGIVS